MLFICELNQHWCLPSVFVMSHHIESARIISESIFESRVGRDPSLGSKTIDLFARLFLAPRTSPLSKAVVGGKLEWTSTREVQAAAAQDKRNR